MSMVLDQHACNAPPPTSIHNAEGHTHRLNDPSHGDRRPYFIPYTPGRIQYPIYKFSNTLFHIIVTLYCFLYTFGLGLSCDRASN